MKNLLYFCIFYNEKYINLSNLLLSSLKKFGNIENNTDILICTSVDFKKKIENNEIIQELNVKFFTFEANSLYEACSSRLRIFNYKNINQYEKILYIDTDILITGNLNKIFNLNIEEKLYAVEEFGSRKWHYFLWKKEKLRWLPKNAFSTGVLLFLNCDKIKELFQETYNHIQTHMKEKKKMPSSVDQPFIIYHCYQKKIYDNNLLNDYITLVFNVSQEEFINQYEKYNKKILLHHVGTGTGGADIKIKLLSNFFEKIKNL
jgi:lipopolysaccharide biosynthesis glycosyltransferase